MTDKNSDLTKNQSESIGAADSDLLARNEGIKSPAFWFFLLSIPILISVYLAFARPDPAQIEAQAAARKLQETQQQTPEAPPSAEHLRGPKRPR